MAQTAADAKYQTVGDFTRRYNRARAERGGTKIYTWLVVTVAIAADVPIRRHSVGYLIDPETAEALTAALDAYMAKHDAFHGGGDGRRAERN